MSESASISLGIASRYASALFELAKEDGALKALESDTSALSETLAGSADLREVIASLQPDVMAVEELYSHYERPRTAILMGHARGVICLAAQTAGIKVNHYEPTRVKKVMTGNGRAPKHQIQLAVKLQLGLATLPEPTDVADAMAIALCGHHLGNGKFEHLIS